MIRILGPGLKHVIFRLLHIIIIGFQILQINKDHICVWSEWSAI